MKGRKPIPTALHVLRGNPGHRNLDARADSEMEINSGFPSCPLHLDEDAKKEWRRLKKEIEASGAVARCDLGALAVYCQAWSQWITACADIQKNGWVFKHKSGYPILNPYISIKNQAEHTMKTIGAELGFTPSSRSRIKVEKKLKTKTDSIFD